MSDFKVGETVFWIREQRNSCGTECSYMQCTVEELRESGKILLVDTTARHSNIKETIWLQPAALERSEQDAAQRLISYLLQRVTAVEKGE